jgi:hypothetical protein
MPVEREHVLALLDCWVHRACDNLAFLRQETRLLADVEAAREANGGELPTPPRGLGKAPPLKPFVITREMVKVFGAGYPSLPTLTVEQAAAREHAMGLHNCCSEYVAPHPHTYARCAALGAARLSCGAMHGAAMPGLRMPRRGCSTKTRRQATWRGTSRR